MHIHSLISFLADLSGVVLLILFVVYFIPTAVALTRRSRYTAPVIVINLFSGWTVLGWVAAFALAVWPEEESPPKRMAPRISHPGDGPA